ncbi:MAG: hypothetical protein QXP66_03725 [Candidatus Aenigmatarchaeota archaeon]
MLEIFRAFLCGLFLFNSLPHLIKGITGQTNMTPFKRVSSPYLNIIWAFTNIGLSLTLLGIEESTGKLNSLSGWSLVSFFIGGILISFADAQLFSNPKSKLPWHKD